MALKLSKAQLTKRDEIVAHLRSTHDDLDRAITVFNEALAAARDAIKPQIDAYGEAIEAAREFASKVAAGAQEAIDAKPERWLDSDKGQAATAYQEAWDGLDLDAELPDTLADAPGKPE